MIDLPKDIFQKLSLIFLGMRMKKNKECPIKKNIIATNSMNDKVLLDNQIPVHNFRSIWLDFIRDLYVNLFFDGNPNLYDLHPRDVLNREGTVLPNQSVFEIELQQLILNDSIYACDLLSSTIFEKLFHSISAIKNDGNVFEIPNDMGK